MQDQAVGWYRDPGRPKLHRYWDGHSWVGPDTAENRLPRQAAPRQAAPLQTAPLQTEDQAGTATFDLSAVLGDAQKDG